MRVTAVVAAATLMGIAMLAGRGIATADASEEKEACQLMDDPSGRDAGYQPVEYAFMVLRGKMSAGDARNVISLAAQDFCPNHIIDLPASWR
ncbi:hypothetical protein [Mycobacterium simiae]|uniref:hypothetical protein n=1 Tax=Mycobacterium simiae TaxID=1784 RepID=UPI0005C8AA05|nr:hypothetical protein [Mycobacterium simiae]PLV44829.1 hypothetical protein X011_25070 [Mycobacterium tuberculosis variant microti OV254]